MACRWYEPSVLQQESSVATLIALSGSAVRHSQPSSVVTLSVGFGLLCRYAAVSVASVACCLVAVQQGQAKGEHSKLQATEAFIHLGLGRMPVSSLAGLHWGAISIQCGPRGLLDHT